MRKIIVACSMLIISIGMIAQSEYSQNTRDNRGYSNNYSDNRNIGIYENYYGISLNPSIARHHPEYINNDWIRISLPSPKIIKRINKGIEKRNKEIRKREKKTIKKWDKQNKEIRKDREKRIEKIEKQNKKSRKQWEKENKKIRKERNKRMKKIGKW